MTTKTTDFQADATNGKNQFACFASRHHQISARQLACKMHIPVNPHTRYQQHIADCFTHIRRQGHANPILIGAIPFDTSRNSTLNFYTDFHKTPAASPQQPATDTTARLTDKQTLVSRQTFEHSVQQALQALDTEEIQKIVLSQAIEYQLDQQQTAEQLFSLLHQQNPAAYNFVIPVEQNQYIFGASPELLLSRQQQQIHSNPLAGSRPRSGSAEQNDRNKEQLYKSGKDRHEHQFVVDNIRNNLSGYCAELKVSEYPDILETSTMFHLSSQFRGKLKQNAPDALSLALHLHPTPAVCGTPTQTARQFILNNEGYDRHYYSGLSGWMDAEGNGEWVVTIRCGLLKNKTIRLYAGAGIVKGSDASAEWFETEAKMQTMLNIFQLK